MTANADLATAQADADAAAAALQTKIEADCNAVDGMEWSSSEGACVESSNAGLVLGLIFGILGAAAVGVLVYCFVFKNKSDDDYKNADSQK